MVKIKAFYDTNIEWSIILNYGEMSYQWQYVQVWWSVEQPQQLPGQGEQPPVSPQQPLCQPLKKDIQGIKSVFINCFHYNVWNLIKNHISKLKKNILRNTKCPESVMNVTFILDF